MRVAPNYETEEGARGSGAARQSNCHRVTKVRGPSHEQKSTENLLPTAFKTPVGSMQNRLLFAECEPIRAFARHVERSAVLASFQGHRLPFSNATFELHGLLVGQPPHGSPRACPDAISHSTGNNEAKATFTRSITLTALTTHRSRRSFRIRVLALSCAPILPSRFTSLPLQMNFAFVWISKLWTRMPARPVQPTH